MKGYNSSMKFVVLISFSLLIFYTILAYSVGMPKTVSDVKNKYRAKITQKHLKNLKKTGSNIYTHIPHVYNNKSIKNKREIEEIKKGKLPQRNKKSLSKKRVVKPKTVALRHSVVRKPKPRSKNVVNANKVTLRKSSVKRAPPRSKLVKAIKKAVLIKKNEKKTTTNSKIQLRNTIVKKPKPRKNNIALQIKPNQKIQKNKQLRKNITPQNRRNIILGKDQKSKIQLKKSESEDNSNEENESNENTESDNGNDQNGETTSPERVYEPNSEEVNSGEPIIINTLRFKMLNPDGYWNQLNLKKIIQKNDPNFKSKISEVISHSQALYKSKNLDWGKIDNVLIGFLKNNVGKKINFADKKVILFNKILELKSSVYEGSNNLREFITNQNYNILASIPQTLKKLNCNSECIMQCKQRFSLDNDKIMSCAKYACKCKNNEEIIKNLFGFEDNEEQSSGSNKTILIMIILIVFFVFVTALNEARKEKTAKSEDTYILQEKNIEENYQNTGEYQAPLITEV